MGQREVLAVHEFSVLSWAPGYDNISMRVIKHSFHLISAPLANIINLSLVKGIFPDKLKLGKVIPIYKTEDPSLFVNYRHISLLPNFSKFFEKVMYISLSRICRNE